MVKEWGMSDKIGRSALSGHSGGGPFMSMQMLQRKTTWGNKILETVEKESEGLVNNSYLIDRRILDYNNDLKALDQGYDRTRSCLCRRK
jgi:ATP-dependent Zn protease